MRDAEECAATIRELYGSDALGEPGVLHVAAVWREPWGRLVTLRIREETPASESDHFVLRLARARADAILTSGRILREEPGLSHGLDGPGAEALAQWRRRRLGRADPPWSVVLSSGRDLDLDHPLFAGPTRPMIFTGAPGAARLGDAARGRGIEVVAHAAPDLRVALEYLGRERGLRTRVIEAGPSTARAAYAAPPLLDELMLSVFEEPALDAAVRGPDFVPAAELARLLAPAAPARTRREASGRWSFQRLLRA